LQWAGLVGLRPGLLPQVARKRAFLDAGGSSLVRHEGRFTDTPPGLAIELPRHASSKRPPATSGTLSPCRWALSLPVSGRKPVKPSRGEPSRPCSFRSGSAQGVLSVCETWRWPGFMTATFQRKQFPLRCAHSSRDKFFSLPGAPLRCARKRCSQPVPRRSDHVPTTSSHRSAIATTMVLPESSPLKSLHLPRQTKVLPGDGKSDGNGPCRSSQISLTTRACVTC